MRKAVSIIWNFTEKYNIPLGRFEMFVFKNSNIIKNVKYYEEHI